MSATETSTTAIDSEQSLREQLHDFHLTGRPLDLPDPLAGAALRPVALKSIEPAAHSFPLCYQPTGAAGFRPLGDLLDEMLAAEGYDVLRGRASTLAGLAAERMAADGQLEASLPKVMQAALAEAAKQPAFNDEDAAGIESDCQRLLTRLPQAARLLALSPAAATLLHVRTLADTRSRARAALVERVRGLLQRLEGMLLRGSEPESVADLSAELGSQSDRFLDAGALSRSLRRTPGHQTLEPKRRERIVQAAQSLRGYLERAAGTTMVSVLHSPQAPSELRQPGVSWIEAETPLEAAVAKAREELTWFGEVLRALRLGALEAEGDYRPETHDRALARMDWRSATREELAGAPLCVAAETAERIADRSLSGLSGALRSGMPLQILALRSAAAAASDAPPDLGYLAIAHREAYVVEAPLWAPPMLVDSLQRMSRTLRPALAVVTTTQSLQQGDAAWRARLAPALRYDPDAGESWADKFSIAGNPAAEEPWAGATPADAAALDPGSRAHFAVLPPEAQSDELMPLADYLAQYADRAPAAIPYIEVEGENGQPLRAAITRDLANGCRETQRAWRIYQELAGMQSASTSRASTGAGEATQQELLSDREQLAAQARREGAESAVYRLVMALTGASAAAPPPAKAPPTQTKAEPKQAPVAAEEASAAAVAGPYVDSALCTSCNECINRVPKMFAYNDDKQAYIADPKGGTYQQLLKAAAACPAECIHPGPPPG